MQRGGRIRRFLLVRLNGGGGRDGIFVFILQTFLETVDAFEQSFEDVCFGAAFFGNGIYSGFSQALGCVVEGPDEAYRRCMGIGRPCMLHS